MGSVKHKINFPPLPANVDDARARITAKQYNNIVVFNNNVPPVT
jgi:hypothetical protein